MSQQRRRFYGAKERQDKSSCQEAKPARLLTVAEAARYMGTTVWAIRCLLWDGELSSIRLGRRLLVDIDDLDGLIESLKTKETR